MIRVDILDSSPIFLQGLTKVLSDQGIRVVGARTSVAATAPQVWLADVFMIDPVAVPVDLAAYVDSAARFGAVLLVVDHKPTHEMADALRSVSTSGTVSRKEPADALVAAVRAVAGGRVVGDARPAAPAASPAAEPGEPEEPTAQLSNREEQVLQQIAHGLTHGQIALRLGISRYTVDTYIKRIRAKLGAGNKAELTRAAMLRAFGASAAVLPMTR